MTSVKFFKKDSLIKANRIAIERNYNRQIKPEYLASLPNNVLYPISFTMIHEHAQGKLVEPHIRCWVYIRESEKVFIDCDMKIYQSLDSWEIPDDVEQAQ